MLLGGLALPMTAEAGIDDNPFIMVETREPGFQISPMLYGIFFEEINRAGEGGIYAEMVQNRSFEDKLRVDEIRRTPLAWGVRNAEAVLENATPLNAKNQTYLNVKTQAGGMIVNGGFVRNFNADMRGALSVASGEKYDLTFYAKSAKSVKLHAAIAADGKEAAGGDVVISGDTWKQYSLVLISGVTSAEATLQISSAEAAEFNLDMVSLFPQKTWKGRKNGLRADLMERLVEMKPAFVRFPGGCFVEGRGIENRAIWKNSIGPVEQRINQYNNNWGYNCSNGLGYHEYLQMCEDLNAEPLFVINCGMGHQLQNGMYAVPMNEMDVFVQDALDAIEYANGDVSTKWGAERAKNGHPAPFNLKYMEIGNENGGADYAERYALIHKAIKAKYPKMNLIANEKTNGFRNDIIDPHMYSSPDRFFRDYTRYDNYDRKEPKVYFGEYAVTSGSGRGNLIAGVAEAAFMTGLERNSDIVIMSSYAPLFIREGWQAWNPNAIVFNQNLSYGTPSYWVQSMFAKNRPDRMFPVTIDGVVEKAVPVAGKIGLGTYQTQAEFKDIKVVKDGKTLFESDFSKGMDGWQRIAGAWKVEDGVLKQTSNDNNTFILAGDPTWDNYTLTVKARKTGGSEGFLISFGVKNREMRRWNIGGWQNASHAVEADDFTDEHVNGSIETGRWYDIKIELKNDTINLYIDNKLLKSQKRLVGQKEAVTAGYDEKAKEVVLKFVNGNDHDMTYTVCTDSNGFIGNVNVQTLSGTDPNGENSFREPEKYAPKTRVIRDIRDSNFEITFPAYSVNVLRWKR